MADPQQALETVNRLVLGMHSVSLSAIDAALKAGVGWHEIGRALAALESSGILLRQATVLFLGLPAADRAAEQAMLAQALGEELLEDVHSERPTDEDVVWAGQFSDSSRTRGSDPALVSPVLV
ncbi:hypothetical protein AR457_39360 [Streptomyces agglomeratus]|uniref:hypothetical protein n=1 Tax=Streptomyces agglomeratus TaxID=285458 RepID=UPI00086B08F1|nr:hypothetical protein [Streptomyces agglomeratus]OEJ21981.1 hypothetical protein AR457_39360 [Streptomyces agglomeratus]